MTKATFIKSLPESTNYRKRNPMTIPSAADTVIHLDWSWTWLQNFKPPDVKTWKMWNKPYTHFYIHLKWSQTWLQNF